MESNKQAGEGVHDSADTVVSARTEAWNEAVAAEFQVPFQVGSLEGVSQGTVLSPPQVRSSRAAQGAARAPGAPVIGPITLEGGDAYPEGVMAVRYGFSGRLHGPRGVMVHPDLTGDKFYLQVRDGDSAVGGGEITELMDCRIGGDDMHGKYGFAGSRGVPNGSSPAYLKPVYTDGGELDWLSMAYLEDNNNCRIVRGAPVMLLKDGLERGFF